jgi:glycosyltransferase involved in cell wall biosynthesis
MLRRHLHFVQSIETLQGGGLGRAALQLSGELGRAGHGSCLVTTKSGESICAGEVFAFGRKGPDRAFFAPDLWTERRRLVQDSDYVHGHGFYVGTNWILGAEVVRQDKPLVYHPHGMFEPWILGRSRFKKWIAHSFFENRNFRHAALWRALTQKEAGQIRGLGIRAPIVVCANGINPTDFDQALALRSAMAATRRTRKLLFLARLHPKKGLDWLVQAWAAQPKGLRDGWRIMVAGPDELGHRKEIERQVEEAALGNIIEFTGAVDGASKMRVLAEADAFILPSRSEGFSVAILEAMACGLPVVATEACNFPEVQTAGGGWCVETTLEGVKTGLHALLSSDDQALVQRGAQARNLVINHYTWPAIAAKINSACEAICP